MTSKQRVVLVACGSFNPITNMHLRMFELARDHLHKLGCYEVIGGILSPVNDAYDKEDLVAANHRIQMIKLALKSTDWLQIDTWETEQNAWSETFVTLSHLQSLVDATYNVGNGSPKQKKLKLDNDIKLCNNKSESNNSVCVKLLCGADLLESFAKPGLWKDEHLVQIIGKYGLVVITRESFSPSRFIYESDMLSRLQNNIHVVTEWIPNDISATKIRRAICRGDSVKYLLQDSVISYIEENKLYRLNDNKYNSYSLPLNDIHCMNDHIPIIPPPIQYRVQSQDESNAGSLRRSKIYSVESEESCREMRSPMSRSSTFERETSV